MAYTKTIWVNGETPINADNLNKIENQLETNTNDINALNTYSTSEQRIGTWIDGKPLYRKVFFFTTPAGNTDYIINTGISMDTIIKIYGGIKESSGAIIPIPTANDFTGTIYATSFRVSNSDIYYLGNSAYENKPAFAVIEYTKTTD